MVCQSRFLWCLMSQLGATLSHRGFSDNSIGCLKLAAVGVIYIMKIGKWYKSELFLCFSRVLTSIPLVVNIECVLVLGALEAAPDIQIHMQMSY